jgi:hypothetical protein
MIPLMQPTHLLVSHELLPTLKVNGGNGEVLHMPNGITPKQPINEMPLSTTKIVTLPTQPTNPITSNNGGNTGKIVTLPVTTVGKTGSVLDLKSGSIQNLKAGSTQELKTGSVQELKGNNVQDLKGYNKDLKVNNSKDRIVDLPVTKSARTEVRETPVIKLNSNPPPTNRFQGNFAPTKTVGLSGGNSGPRFAQTMGGGGFGRKFH